MSRKYLPICHSELVSESTDTMKVKDSDPSADGRNDKKDLFRLDSLTRKIHNFSTLKNYQQIWCFLNLKFGYF